MYALNTENTCSLHIDMEIWENTFYGFLFGKKHFPSREQKHFLCDHSEYIQLNIQSKLRR